MIKDNIDDLKCCGNCRHTKDYNPFFKGYYCDMQNGKVYSVHSRCDGWTKDSYDFNTRLHVEIKT